MSEENGAVAGTDTIKESMCVLSNAEDQIRFARQFIDLGFNELFFHSAGPDQQAFISGYGRDVLPALREVVTRAA